MYETIDKDGWLHAGASVCEIMYYETIDKDGWLHRDDNVCEIMYV